MKSNTPKPAGWRHERQHFYKYVSFSALQPILTTCSLRWSRPSCFNDPFDIQASFFTPNAEEIVDEAWAIAMAFQLRRITVSDKRRADLIASLQQAARSMPPAKYADLCRTIAETVPQYALGVVEALSELAKKNFASCQVLCLTTDPDNLTMWSHYADSHRGAVLRLTYVEELGSAWGAAEPVRYSGRFPSLGDSKEWAERFWGYRPEVTAAEMLDQFVLTKSTDWDREKEWRIVDHIHAVEDFRDVPFAPRELTQVILGMKMPIEQRRLTSGLLRAGYPHCNLFEAKMQADTFGLSFEEVLEP